MSFPASALRVKGGDCYAHLFENAAVGVARGLYWSFALQFEAFEYKGETVAPRATVEWIHGLSPDWRNNPGFRLEGADRDASVEASFYVWEHEPARRFAFEVLDRRGADFHIRIAMDVDANPLLHVEGDGWVRYQGILVSRDNFTPKPASIDDAKHMVAPFAATDGYADCVPTAEGFRFVPLREVS